MSARIGCRRAIPDRRWPARIGELLLAPLVRRASWPALAAISAQAFSFPAPRVDRSDGRLGVLELFHGPTAAFKDFGARFLAACMARLRTPAAAAAEYPGRNLG